MAAINEIAAQIMEHLCSHDWHGYTQGNRWGDGEYEALEIDGKKYTIAQGDRDCSSAIISAYRAAVVGTEYEGVFDAATYTGNMRSVFTQSGLFEWQPMSFIAQRGDIYLDEREHTAMCVSSEPDMLAEFSISENGTIYGVVGDQTGNESSIHGYYDYPWDGILHYVGDVQGNGTTSTIAPTSTPELTYRVRVNGAWLGEMKDFICSDGCGDDYAGVLGKPIEYIAIKMSGWYQVKTSNGWLDPVRGYNIDDLDNGCAGDGTPIVAIRCYYETENPAYNGWLAIEYQTHILGGDWLGKMHDLTDTEGDSEDFAGDKDKPIDGFRAKLVHV